jgi:hypothetical protein
MLNIINDDEQVQTERDCVHACVHVLQIQITIKCKYTKTKRLSTMEKDEVINKIKPSTSKP